MIKLHKATPSQNSAKLNDKLSFNLILDILEPLESVSFRAIYLGSLEQNNNIELCNEFIKEIPAARVSFDLDCNYVPLKKIKEDVFVDDEGKVLFDNLDERLNIPRDSLFGNTSIVISICVKDKEVLRIGFIINVKYPGIPNMFLEKNIIDDSDESSQYDSGIYEQSDTDDESNGIEHSGDNKDVEEHSDNVERQEETPEKRIKLQSEDESSVSGTQEDVNEEESASVSSNNEESNNEESNNDSELINVEEFTYEQIPIKDISPEDRYPYANYVLKISEIYFTISEQQIETYFNIEEDSESDDEVLDLEFGSEEESSATNKSNEKV